MRSLVQNKKGSGFLIGVGYAIVALIILVGVGLVISSKMGDLTAACADGNTSGSVTQERLSMLNNTGSYTTQSTRKSVVCTLGTIINSTGGKTITQAGNYTISNCKVTIVDGSEYNNTLVNISSYTYQWDDTHTWNTTTQSCLNDSGGDAETGLGSGYLAFKYGAEQLGQAGLLGWLPAVVALIIGMFFLAYFMGKKNQGY